MLHSVLGEAPDRKFESIPQGKGLLAWDRRARPKTSVRR